jgi:chemotaxis protein methyltransferase WspC
MSFENLQHLIRSETGLTVESVGADTIRRFIERRMQAVGIQDVYNYLALVESSPVEKQNLINEVMVPETWFFRDHEPFRVLEEYVKEMILKSPGRSVKVLSVPCSTGEEPYSIAMVMLEAGLGQKQFQIDAADISTAVIEKAISGSYGSNSFRGKDNSLRDKYFQLAGDGRYHIDARIRNAVRFHNANVLDASFMEGCGPYDIVFCRNMLIYFDYETKCRVLTTLHKLMADAGLLILGHAETGRMPDSLFDTLHLPGAFAYRKVDPAASRNPVAPISPSAVDVSALNRLNRFARQFAKKAANTQENVKKPLPRQEEKRVSRQLEAESLPVSGQDNVAVIDNIQSLADQGDLKEALTVCDRLIESVPDLAQAYYLKGVILLAMDLDEDAGIAFKRALYLDAQHYESMIQLSVLAEEAGDLQAAENYRARAERARNNEGRQSMSSGSES